MRFSVGVLISASLLGGCSHTGNSGSDTLFGSLVDAREGASPKASASDSDVSAQLASQAQSYAEAEKKQEPGVSSTSGGLAGGGLAGLFAAFRAEPAPEPEPEPLPEPQPPGVTLARAEEERVLEPAPASASHTQAIARSLDAYERREAGVPDAEDDDELEQLAVKPAAAQPGSAAPNMAFNYTPAHFEISGVQPLPLLAAPPPGASRSSNGPALNTPAQRWRPAYDNVETACFPQELRNALDKIAAHFNAEVLVTSGARANGRRGSLHRSCKAADIRIAGVEPAELAAYARTVPGLNGVGSYRRVSVTHIDVRDERFAWRW